LSRPKPRAPTAAAGDRLLIAGSIVAGDDDERAVGAAIAIVQ
jgi:hypothetical protein